MQQPKVFEYKHTFSAGLLAVGAKRRPKPLHHRVPCWSDHMELADTPWTASQDSNDLEQETETPTSIQSQPQKYSLKQLGGDGWV